MTVLGCTVSINSFDLIVVEVSRSVNLCIREQIEVLQSVLNFFQIQFHLKVERLTHASDVTTP